MPLRLLESIVPTHALEVFESLTETDTVVDRWDETLNSDKSLVRMLVNASDVERLMDELVERFKGVEEFRVMLLPVEATLPRPVAAENGELPAANTKSPERISREELYNLVSESGSLTKFFVAQVVLATIVAAIGLIRNDVAIIIGAMVIAPLLGPNMSLSLATTLGDYQLALRSLKANAVGLLVTLIASLAVGFTFDFDASNEALRSRTQVSAGDIVLALASGCAGAMAFTASAPSALIGVMVAVALLPPSVVFGLHLAMGEFNLAIGSLMLVATNIICVNLAGVVTFVMQGLRPQSWWDAERANKATRIAIASWILLLTILAILIYYGIGSPLDDIN